MTTQPRNLFAVVISEPLALAAAQPHQILISTASVALMGQFASSSGILDPFVGYALAIGIEWAYLRGLASDSKTQTEWGARLNWSAFVIVVLWGCLWCLHAFKVLPETPDGTLGYILAAAHVVPIAWLSLCSAMCHRASMQAEAAKQEAIEAERREQARKEREAENALRFEAQREQARLEAWKDAQTFKAQLATTQRNQSQRVAQPFTPGQMGCKHCGVQVEFSTASEKGVITRLGCAACREQRKANKGGK